LGVAQDLLEQARYLAHYHDVNASQADLRRSISTAYYALFHLLAEDGGGRWLGGSSAAASGLERALDHWAMRNSSRQFTAATWVDWRGLQRPIPLGLQHVAIAFLELQNARLLADYDNYKEWSITQVQELLNTVEEAFQDWNSVRGDAMAGDYLLSMILGKRR
jgi:uncharacterized protein (UPF0332 family)